MSAEQEAAAKLLETSDAGLLRTFAALTHRLHEAEPRSLGALHAPGKRAPGLRAQRDVVENEILRRMKTDGVGP